MSQLFDPLMGHYYFFTSLFIFTDPPSSDKCHYQPISTLDRNLKQFMRPVVVQNISPIMLENFRGNIIVLLILLLDFCHFYIFIKCM